MRYRTLSDDLDLAKWKEQARNEAIFRLRGGSEAGRLLEISPTNRVITPEQAGLLMALRLQAECLGSAFQWLVDMCDEAEKYQLTVGVPKNSRDVYGAVLSARMSVEQVERAQRGWWSRLTGGGVGG